MAIGFEKLPHDGIVLNEENVMCQDDNGLAPNLFQLNMSQMPPKQCPPEWFSPEIFSSAERIRELMTLLSKEFDEMQRSTIILARENSDLRQHAERISFEPASQPKEASESADTRPKNVSQVRFKADASTSHGSDPIDVCGRTLSDGTENGTSQDDLRDSTLKTNSAKPMKSDRSYKTLVKGRSSLMESLEDKALSVERSVARKRHRKKETPGFDLLMGIFILAYTMVLALSYQLEGYKIASEAGFDESASEWESLKVFFFVLDHVFCLIFTAEIIMRTWWHGYIYFLEPLGLFELIIVILGMVELYILEPMNKSSGANFNVLRISRVFRLFRVLRIVRVLSLFSALRVLTKTIASCITSLAWAMVLLMLIVCASGLVACQLVRERITDDELDIELRSWLFMYYGTSTRSIYSIFEATLSGCWPNYARPLIDNVDGWWAMYWIFYTTFIIFAIVSIIRAIFLKETLQNAGADADTMIQDHIMKKAAYREKLKDAFESIDVMGVGSISREDFEFIIKLPKVQALMAVLDIEVHDGNRVFQMLEEDNDGSLTYQEFLEGIMCLKGNARQLDVVSIQRDCKFLMESLVKLTQGFEKVHGVLIDSSAATHHMSAGHGLRKASLIDELEGEEDD